MITSDVQAWDCYPYHREWFNKMWVASTLGYKHGPGGIPVPEPGEYVVRPDVNLYGMGAGASIQYLTPELSEQVPPGYFWCEIFIGEQLSYELSWNSNHNDWDVTSVWLAERSGENLSLFDRWVRVERSITLPPIINTLWDCGSINIETVGGHIIEVHLRSTPDPTTWTEMIPVWEHTPVSQLQPMLGTHKFIESPDYVYGTQIKRIGFMCR